MQARKLVGAQHEIKSWGPTDVKERNEGGKENTRRKC